MLWPISNLLRSASYEAPGPSAELLGKLPRIVQLGREKLLEEPLQRLEAEMQLPAPGRPAQHGLQLSGSGTQDDAMQVVSSLQNSFVAAIGGM